MNNNFNYHRRIHITDTTYTHLKDDYEVEDGNGGTRSEYLRQRNVKTYLSKRRKHHKVNSIILKIPTLIINNLKFLDE